MKGQFRTQRHCPPDELPHHFDILIDGVVYSFARHAVQPDNIADNQLLFNVFVEDGLKTSKVQS